MLTKGVWGLLDPPAHPQKMAAAVLWKLTSSWFRAGSSSRDQYSELAVLKAAACQIHRYIDPRIPGVGMYYAALGWSAIGTEV